MFIFSLGLINHQQSPSSLYTISSSPYKRYEPFTTSRLGLFKFQVVRFLHRLIYGTKRYQELFPPIKKIKDINNVKQQVIFPVNCAADDLDLGFGDSDQIELYNNTHHHQSKNEFPEFEDFFDNNKHNHHHHHHLPMYQIPSFNEDVFGTTTPQPIPQSQVQPQVQQITNYYDYFNDFNFPSNKDDSVYGSSSSDVSPLDDEILGGIIPVDSSKQIPIQRHLSISSSSVDSFDVPRLSSSCSSSTSSSTSSKKTSKRKKNQELAENMTITTTTTTNNIQVTKITKRTSDGGIANEFFCPFDNCGAVFSVKGYLTRHLKKHSANKTFRCPFYDPSSKCHPTGGFSRRDTFKTHLKALHFVYPPGVKSCDRNKYPGRCAGCFLFFENNVDWLQNHIEKGLCTGSASYKASLQLD
ncbi:STP3 Transcriptional regulator STP3 [Candida maltosa Xu316]